MDVSLCELQELVMDREGWRAAIWWLQCVGHDWATELNWTESYLASKRAEKSSEAKQKEKKENDTHLDAES